jgi:hypothetical protein
MLPAIPSSAIPTVPQPEQIKARTEVAPVAPAVDTPNQSEVGVGGRDPGETIARLKEEQKRRRRRGYSPQSLSEGDVEPEDIALIENLPRQGLWVDVEV